MRWLLLSAFLSSVAFAQEQPPTDPMTALAEVRERLRAYERDANNRQNLLGRKAQVLQLLTDGADSISAFGAGFATDRAQKKLEEARRIAGDAALGESVPAVLGALEQVLSQPGSQTAAELRANAFLAVNRLEEDLLQQTEALQREALELQQLATGITMTVNNLSSTSANSVRTSVRTRRLAAKR